MRVAGWGSTAAALVHTAASRRCGEVGCVGVSSHTHSIYWGSGKDHGPLASATVSVG